MADDQRPIIKTVWHSTDRRTWKPVGVRAGALLSLAFVHTPDSFWSDGFGNYYRNSPPVDAGADGGS